MKKMNLSPSNKTFIVSFILVITGILTGGLLHPYFYLIAGLGLFGPGLLRELSILNDQDDFQRASSRKAGNMAFLITGFILLLVICLKTAGKFQGVGGKPFELWSGILCIGLGIYCSVYLSQFWGGKKAALRLLVISGVIWTVFIVLSEWRDPIGLLLEFALVPFPLFLAVLLGIKWHRYVPLLLIPLSIFYLLYFHLYSISIQQWGKLIVIIFLVLPPFIAGILFIHEGIEEKKHNRRSRQ